MKNHKRFILLYAFDILSREIYFKFRSIASINFPVRSLLKGRQTSNWSNFSTKRNNWSMVLKFNLSSSKMKNVFYTYFDQTKCVLKINFESISFHYNVSEFSWKTISHFMTYNVIFHEDTSITNVF